MDRQQQILTWTSAFLLGVSLQRWFRQWRDSAKERLHSILGRAAQWTAGMRAVESLESVDALFVDDMASDLAGKRTWRRALQLAEVRGASFLDSSRMPQLCVISIIPFFFFNVL